MKPPAMVRRVGKAIADAGICCDSDCLRQARAAIQAMREPTAAMLTAGYEKGCGGWGEGEECGPIWTSMIDAALGL